MLIPAPLGATQTKVELALGWAPDGTVWWQDVSLAMAAPPPPRMVRIGSISLHPQGLPNKEASIAFALDSVDRIANDKPDIVCLGEGVPMLGNSETYLGVAEPIPGPISNAFGAKARQHRIYLIAGMCEREGDTVYNTAVLFDRNGSVAGKYRKVYLPREEIEGGLTPGSDFPVFETDFGKIGIMVCWDSQYVDPARALVSRGAEIIFVPAAGASLVLLQARALENHAFLVSSVRDGDTAVINPLGEILHATREPGVFKVITIDLQQRFVDPWLGDMRPRYFKEMRWDVLEREIGQQELGRERNPH